METIKALVLCACVATCHAKGYTIYPRFRARSTTGRARFLCLHCQPFVRAELHLTKDSLSQLQAPITVRYYKRINNIT